MQYRPHRYPTEFPVAMRTPTGPQKGKVIDVNNVGARLKGMRDLRRGDKVQVNILSMNVDAVVQWAASETIGITFRPQITDTQVDTLRFRPDGRTGRRPSSVGFGFAEMR